MFHQTSQHQKVYKADHMVSTWSVYKIIKSEAWKERGTGWGGLGVLCPLDGLSTAVLGHSMSEPSRLPPELHREREEVAQELTLQPPCHTAPTQAL